MKAVLRYPRIVIFSVILLTVFFLLQLPNIRVNNDLSLFMGENNPAKAAYDAMRDIYESSDAIVVALHNPHGSILSADNLSLIDDLTQQFEKIPLIRSVVSLTNGDFITGNDEGLVVEPLYPGGKWTSLSEKELKSRLLSWPEMYRLTLYSDDFQSTQILMNMKSGLEVELLEEAHETIIEILNSADTGHLQIYVAGAPAISVILKEKMYRDMSMLIPVVALVVLAVLFLSFRTAAGVILPLLAVAISSIWTLGLMSLLNIRLTMVGTAIPVILVSVGSAYGIHLISHYYDELLRYGKPIHTREEHRDLILSVLNKAGIPIALTGLTTMVGFGSMISSSIVPMRESSIFLVFGVFTALFIALIVIPSILILRHGQLKKHDKKQTRGTPLMDRFLLYFYDLFVRHSVRNLLLTFLIIILSFVGMFRIIVDTNMIETFRPNTTIAGADRFQNENFGGTTILNVIVDGGKKGALLEPEILQAVDDLGIYLMSEVPLVGKVTSFTDLIKRMNQIMHIPGQEEEILPSKNQPIKEESGFSFEDAGFSADYEENSSFSFDDEGSFSFEADMGESDDMIQSDAQAPEFSKITPDNLMELLQTIRLERNTRSLSGDDLIFELEKLINYNGAAYYEIPVDPNKYPAAAGELRNLIAQYLLLYSGSVDDFIDDALEPSQTRMMVQMKSPKNADTRAVEKSILDYAAATFPPGYTVSVTGLGKLAGSVNGLTIRSQTNSILTSLIIVFIIIAFSYRSWVAGFYGIITLSLSLLINFGIMGFFNIKLDMGSSMVASVAIGIGIDYTIHFLSRYRLERQKSNDLAEVTKNTLLTSGKAILFNASAVAAGFSVLIYSSFIPLENLGLLIALTMVTSSLGALMVLPALLNTFKPNFIQKERRLS